MTVPILVPRSRVEQITGLTRSSIYRHMQIGDFPRPLKLGPKSVRWVQDEVVLWVESRPRTESKGADSC